MLPTFRILLATMALAIVAVAVAAHGLVPTPEVYTRIGEVPAVGRLLVQQAMVPRLPIQALSDPADERTAIPEATGMASGLEIVRVPPDKADESDPEQTELGSAKTSSEGEAADPLGDLIRATAPQPSEPLLTSIVTPKPPDSVGPQTSAPARDLNAAPATVARDRRESSADDTSSPAKNRAENAPQVTSGKSAAPAESETTAEAETKDAAPPAGETNARVDGKDPTPAEKTETAAKAEIMATLPHTNEDSARLPPPREPPTLALGDDSKIGEKPNAKSPRKAPGSASAALGNAARDKDLAAAVSKRRDKSARKAMERRKHRTAVEKRKVRRKAVTKSRAASAIKTRKAVSRVKRHRSRRVTDPAPRRGVVVVSPRRHVQPGAPSARYFSPTYLQTAPAGYYLAPAGTAVTR